MTDGDGIAPCDASAGCRVEAYCQGLNEAEFFEGKFCAVEFFGGDRNAFGEGSVALHAQGLVVLARIGALAAT